MRRNDREVTDLKEIEAILRECKTCHLAMTDNGMPYVIPISYGYELSENTLTLFFHSAREGRKIDILRNNSDVCFEMSSEGELSFSSKTPCSSGYYFKSVHGFGNVSFLEDHNEKCRALTLLMKHQTMSDVEFNFAQTKNLCIFKVTSTSFSGKRRDSREQPDSGKTPIKFEVLDSDFTICKMEDLSSLNCSGKFFFIGKTDEELSVVCDTSHVPDGIRDRDDGWNAFRISGTLDFSLTGILSAISSVLAAHNIGIFAISTYNTDYILVKKENVRKALMVLEANIAFL